MAKFAIYNYQFEPMLEKVEQMTINFPDWEKVDPKMSFENRQQIFGKILEDDFTGEHKLEFTYRNRPYRHDHLMKPTDDIIVMRVANKKTVVLTGPDLKTSPHDDYPNCLVVIDNRPGIQRLLIEQKSAAFSETSTVANIMQATFNQKLKYYKLSISLDAIYRTSEFKHTVGQWPDGFRKVILHLPHKNLDRVMENLEMSLTDVRTDWETAMDISFIAPKGGRVPIDVNNKRQMALMDLGATIGGSSVEMIPTGKRQASVWCGKGTYVTEAMEDKIFKEFEENHGEIAMFEEDNPINRLKLSLKAIKNRYD